MTKKSKSNNCHEKFWQVSCSAFWCSQDSVPVASGKKGLGKVQVPQGNGNNYQHWGGTDGLLERTHDSSIPVRHLHGHTVWAERSFNPANVWSLSVTQKVRFWHKNIGFGQVSLWRSGRSLCHPCILSVWRDEDEKDCPTVVARHEEKQDILLNDNRLGSLYLDSGGPKSFLQGSDASAGVDGALLGSSVWILWVFNADLLQSQLEHFHQFRRRSKILGILQQVYVQCLLWCASKISHLSTGHSQEAFTSSGIRTGSDWNGRDS